MYITLLCSRNNIGLENLTSAKTLESATALRLSYMTHEQSAARLGNSTVDATLTFTHYVEAARDHNLLTTSVTLYIKGFFDYYICEP